MRVPSRLVQRVHFEDFGGQEFERLAFAYHVRAGWRDLAWYGEVGNDGGRDIVGAEPVGPNVLRQTVIQCANRNELTLAKAKEDMAKALASVDSGVAFKFICRGSVPARRRDGLTQLARELGVRHLTVWSGVEFEEHLRLHAEDLLRRFCGGETFPSDPTALKTFANDFPGLTDAEALRMLAAVFDRPAFRTPFQQESSLPNFLSAVEDTISALNTGRWNARDGGEIRRIPSRHHLRDPALRAGLAEAAQAVDELRRTFVRRLRDGSIRPCGCHSPDCPVFMLEDEAARDMDEARRVALRAIRKVYPAFDVWVA